ncbi:hypothetical protein [Stenotrophomonas tumulicola]|uniref:Secreted protein n=1 Tax=Stenotrophomonas tumulicola TaxID=1685415 RepID=A0A7W3FJG2_9GAMM|nr:hypothetical protein [Stenotrophomonas tumulicola]MBA8680580.1 hypothetical protein [Stenotrophomonas tumulicola]
MRLLLLLAAGALLGACSTLQGPPSVPTALKTGQSWVVTRPVVAAQVLDTCSRPSPGRDAGRVTGYWAPSRQQVEQLEAQLPTLRDQVADAVDFDRQYVGIEADGRELIYVNAFKLPDGSNINPARQAIRICDGGAMSWGAVFDPTTAVFSEFHPNGGW